MTEQKAKRRGWVKNAIIIFLAGLLILTFFSNTIMNRSLPEVATQYTSSGTINTMIRGTGTATANETYEVKIDQTRTVLSAAVRVGQEVTPDTVVFKLKDAESDELGTMREQLEEAEYNYQVALLNASSNDGSQNNRDIQRAREDLETAQKELALLKDATPDEIGAVKTRISELKARLSVLQDDLDKAQAALEELGGFDPGTDGGSTQGITRAQAQLNEAKTSYDAVYLRYGADYEKLSAIAGSLVMLQSPAKYTQDAFREALAAEFGAPTTEPVVEVPDTDSVFVRRADGETIQYPIDTEHPDNNVLSKKDLADAYTYVTNAKQAVASAQEAYNEAIDSYYSHSSGGNEVEYKARKAKYDEAKKARDTVNGELEDKVQELADLENRKQEYAQAKSTVRSLSDQLENLLLQQKQNGIDQSITALGLERQRKNIETMRSDIEQMESGGTLTEVLANVSGIVRSISVSAGNKAPADTVLATIEVVDRGYSLNMPVTAEQASKVRVGDTAEVSTYSWGSNITATLTAIRNDPDKPGQGKILIFSLSGDVESGESLNVAIGQRSQYYDIIVPNSAIHEDSNGTFVFVVEAKNSPLGNRYFATRANVTILAKDDNNSAVSGSLSSWGSSVVTSSPPLTAGMQVRLAENG